MSSAPTSPEPGPVANCAALKPGIPDYELVRVVGRGSYGDVWLARSVTGAWRAIKVVWRDRFANAEPFEREFRGLKEFADVSLGESSQMALLHVGRNDAAGFFYYVMELADDAAHDRRVEPATYVPLTLAELRTRRGRIPADECARIGVELARALASLHRRGLVHRDVKPSNVILVSGVPKLADIGLVAPAASAQTFVGTEGYVPPEGPGAPSADVFALAKMLYELSTGHDRQEFPKLPAELARFPDRAALLELNEIFLRACGPAPAGRYRDGAAILADLTALSAGVSLRTRRVIAFALRVAAAVAVVAAIAGGGWYWKMRPAPSPLPIAKGVSAHAVAVLPFVDATGDPTKDYFSDALSYEVGYVLERERDLRVTGSRASFWGKNQELAKPELAKALRVAQLVEGSLQQVDTRIHLEVRLTRSADGVSEPLGTFERERSEVFALEEDVARAVAQRILGRVTMPALVPPTKNLAAYEAFLRGRARQTSIVLIKNPEVVGQAREAAAYFQKAAELDPGFALAWARYADALRMSGQNSGGEKVWPDPAAAAVERALKLQPDLAFAWTVRGIIRGNGLDQPDGLRDVFQAEALGGPTADTVMARFMVSWNTSEPHSLPPLAQEAIERNPENVERIGAIPLALWYLGEFAEADRLYQRTGELGARVFLRRDWRGAEAALQLARRESSDRYARFLQVHLLAALGRTAEAAKLLEGVELTPDMWGFCADAGWMDRAREFAKIRLPALRQKLADYPSGGEPVGKDGARATLIKAEILLDHREEALALLNEWRIDLQKRKSNRRAGGEPVTDLPRCYAKLGMKEEAITLLREMMDYGRVMGYRLRDTPEYAPLRDDPRFLELRKRAEDWVAVQPDPADDPAVTVRR